MASFLRTITPKEKSDLFAIGTAVFLLLLVTFNDISALSRQESEFSETNRFVKLVLGLYILFNCFGNMYKAMTTDTTIHSIDLPRILLAEWRYCSACELNAPPRSHHCFTCNKCVLKRHNHCMFLGKCAGHKNQRYYLAFILHVWLGTLISLIINADYYLNVFNDIGLKKVFLTFMPWLGFTLGMISIGDFCWIFANSVCFFLFILLFVYFFINMRMALNGQTWHEKTHDIRRYQLSPYENFVEVFGYNWLAALLNPFARLNLPSDGSKFRVNIEHASKPTQSQQHQQPDAYNQYQHYDQQGTSLNRRTTDNVRTY